jgi:hypothetical protein
MADLRNTRMSCGDEKDDRGLCPCDDNDAALDRAYYEGARQYQRMAAQSVAVADEWVSGGCGGRGPCH